MLRKKLTLSLATLTTAALIGSATQAATITWSSTQSSTDANISTTGTLLEAANFGGSTVEANGVTFEGVTSWPTDPYPLSNLAGINYSSTSAASGFPVTGGGIDTIFSSVGLTGTLNPLTLTGLESGKDYVVQIFLYFGGGAGSRTLTVNDGAGSSTVVTYNEANVITGTFTADGTTQAMNWQESTGSNLTNGYQLRVVPEPGSLALLGLGGLLVASRRRRD